MPKKILVVEDEIETQKLLKAFLSSKGMDVSTAQDGVEALERIKNLMPDIILLDVIMPRMDGYSFLREIRKDPKFRTTPVVVLTAREMMRDLFILEGTRDFLLKPFNPDELYATLSKYL